MEGWQIPFHSLLSIRFAAANNGPAAKQTAQLAHLQLLPVAWLIAPVLRAWEKKKKTAGYTAFFFFRMDLREVRFGYDTVTQSSPQAMGHSDPKILFKSFQVTLRTQKQ